MVEYFAPAKINLGLTILFRYPNGYHHIVSPLTSISFGDLVQIDFSSASSSVSSLFSLEPSSQKKIQEEFSWENKLPPSYADEPKLLAAFDVLDKKKLQNNLLYKARDNVLCLQDDKQFATMFPQLKKKLQDFPALKIHLIKRVPSPCGVGGGSSDAASVFRFYFDELIKEENLSNEQQKHLLKFFYRQALQTGADVPFFLKKKVFKKQTALIDGTGNTAEDKRLPIPSLSGILGIPKFSFSTAEMYAELKKPLQHECYSRNNQKDAVSCYRDFFFHLFWQKKKKSSLARLKENPIVSAFVKTDSRIVLLKNEFLTTARDLFPDDYARLTNGMLLASQMLIEKFSLEFALTSMSGSGSAFYALFADNEESFESGFSKKNFSETKLSEVVETLKKSEPSVYWVKVHNKNFGP